MRHAMRDMLRRPPAGFEAQARAAETRAPRRARREMRRNNPATTPPRARPQVRAHFRTVRPLLLRNLARWLDEASTPSARLQLERAYAELKPLLDGLGAESAGDADGAAAKTEE